MSTTSYLLRVRPTYTSGIISRSVSRNSLSKPSLGNTRLFTSNRLSSMKGVGQSSALAAVEATRVGGMRVTTPLHIRRSVLGLPSQQARLQSTDTSTKDTTSTSPEPPSPAVETRETKSEESTKQSETANAANASESKPKEASDGSKEKSKGPAEKQKAELEKLKEEKEDLMSRLRYLQADLLNTQRIANAEKEKMKDFAITKFATDLLQTVDTLEMALKSAATPLPVTTASSTSSSTSSSSSSGTSSDTSSGTSSGTSSSTSSSDSDVESSTSPTSSSTAAPSTTSSTTTTASTSTPDSALLQGIDLTHRILLSTLASHNIKPFNPLGEPFDPNWHEALFEVPQAVARVTPAMQGKDVKPGLIMDTFKVGYKIKDRCLRAAQVGVVGES
ncbi:Mitochondrial matrix cochaperone [Serendipita sp. 411]|nr:Mitochondrial matrix cochaperone [Serendipita sp. 411]